MEQQELVRLARTPAARGGVGEARVDIARLESRLAGRVRGEVRFAPGDRALYAADASNYRLPPLGVVLPRSAEDVVVAIAEARACDAPVLMRGGGTALAGQTCNHALVLDTSKYFNRLVSLDHEARRATVEPGLVLDDLRHAAAPYGLTFGPDPATHNRCTLGGMIGNNSCGVHSVMAEFYGHGPHTLHQIEALDVLLYDGTRLELGPMDEPSLQAAARDGGRRGEIFRALGELRDRYADEIRRRFPKHLIRRASGYPIDQLLPENGCHVARALVGTEGTCVALLGATVTLMHDPRYRTLLVLGYPTVYEAGDRVPRLREFRPVALEGMDDEVVKDMRESGIHPDALKLLPDGSGFLLAEFGGDTQDEADARAHDAFETLEKEKHPAAMRIYSDPAQQTRIWEVREAGLGATAFVPGKPEAWPGWEDSSVPVEHVGEYLRDLRGLFDKYGYHASLYGHFGQGCIHCRVDFDLYTASGIERYLAFTDEAAHLVCDKYQGSLSGEHGDGQSRADLLPIMFGDTLMHAFREFRAIWDPDERMNPNKTVGGYTRSEELRLGVTYDPPELQTHFKFPEDEGSFARATLRCVGVGLCRRHEGGTMCPSYMATHEEEHSTRGRTHLLFEMLRGELVDESWKSEKVKEALDLCLACKGCKGDCPVHVDVATYKAEFLSHYYRHKLRPRHAYAFGLIHRWASLASRVPRLANAATHWPGVSHLSKWAMGMAPERSVPRFATQTFRDRFRPRTPAPPPGAPRRVMLWTDTFNDHFFPGTLAAAAAVLERGGFTVVLPPPGLCCGRPLYDFGMLDRAEKQLRQILGALHDELTVGTPIVGLEPSCVSVFRDELHNLMPKDEDAKRLRDQVVTFGDFVASHLDDDFALPKLGRRAIVHAHCHHKTVLSTEGEKRVLDAMGVEHQWLQSGCCGMAGAFGFERDRYEVSIAVGERVLLPAVRAADEDTLIIADGFSCREQIAQTTKRRALHLADVVQLAAGGRA